jgi:hypothetical protein
MDVCQALEIALRRSCAVERWSDDPVLADSNGLDDLIREIRVLGDRSDEALRALVRAARRDPHAVEATVVALLPLALSRCRGSQDRADELIGELVIVIAEAAQRGLPLSPRRVANVLVDRAWGRVRGPSRRVRQPVMVDPVELGWRLVDRGPDPADVAISRMMLDALVQAVRAKASSQAATARAWNVAVSLADVESRSVSDRVRLKYARRVLRRSLAADLVA